MIFAEGKRAFIFKESLNSFTVLGEKKKKKALQYVFSIFNEKSRRTYFDMILSLKDRDKLSDFENNFAQALMTSIEVFLSDYLPGFIFVKGTSWPTTNTWYFEGDKLAVLFGLPIPQGPAMYLSLVQRSILVRENSEVITAVTQRVSQGMQLLGSRLEQQTLAGFEYQPQSKAFREAISLFAQGTFD